MALFVGGLILCLLCITDCRNLSAGEVTLLFAMGAAMPNPRLTACRPKVPGTRGRTGSRQGPVRIRRR